MKMYNRTEKYILSAMLVLALLTVAAVWGAAGEDSDSTPTAPTLVVKNGNDSGDDSLRDVIAFASNGNTITFDPSVTTVTLLSEISFSKLNLTIDGGAGGVTITKNVADDFRLINSTETSLNMLTLKNLTFENGRNISGYGGGVFSQSRITLENCVFQNNAARYGGGMYASARATVTGCTFLNNTANVEAGGMYGWGDSTLTDCTFIGNTAGDSGGGVSIRGGVTLTGCTFIGNTVNDDRGDGGGVCAGSIFIDSCTFIDNTAGYGSAVSSYNYANTLIMTNCTISSNTTTNLRNSGAVEFDGRAYIFHCTVTNNTGGGICAWSTSFGTAVLYLRNSIVAGNTPSQISNYGTVISNENLVEGEDIPGSSPAVAVSYRQIFGTTTVDPTSGTHDILVNGIAAGTATKITTADLTAITTLSSAERTAVFAALANDQSGIPRSGSVSYGAVESGDDALVSIAVVTPPTKASYATGDTLDLTGTQLLLTYLSTATETISYNEPGVDIDVTGVNMNALGTYTVDFTYLGETCSTSIIVNMYGTTTTLSASSSSSTYGASVTLTATVSSSASGFTGTVNFYDGSTLIASGVALSGATATYSTSALGTGTHSLSAVYSGDTSYVTSTGALSHTVGKADTSVTLTASPASPQTYGTNITLTATVSSSASGFTGTVDFYDGSTLMASGVALSGATAAYSTSALGTGTHSLSAVYSGDTNFNDSNGGSGFTISRAVTSVSLTASPASAVYGGTVMLTATVSSGVSGFTGTVDFYDGSTLMASGVALSGATAAYSTSALGAGSHNFTAVYSGDTNFDDSNGGTSYAISKAATSVALTVSPAAPIYGDAVTLTAVVSSGVSGFTGTVNFYDGATLIASGVALSGAAAVYSTSALNAGSHDLRAEYSGASNFDTSDDRYLNYIIGKATPVYTVPSGIEARTGQILNDVSLPAGFTWDDPLSTPVGMPGLNTFTVTFTPADTVNYDVVSGIPVDIMVRSPSASSLIIDGGSVVKTYGDPNFFLTTKSGPPGVVMWYSSNPELVSINPTTGEVTIKGATNDTIVTITAKKSSATASIVVTVNKKPITVTADDKEKRAGEADPVLTYSMSPAPLAKDTLSGSLRHSGSEPGKYDIVDDGSFGADPNYAVTFVKGTMTITPDNDFPWWILILIIIVVVCVIIIIAVARRKKV